MFYYFRCTKKFKLKGELKQHLMQKHNVGVVWLTCSVEGCEHQFKTKGNLKKHLAQAHDIGVKWVNCTIGGCTKQFKSKSEVKQVLEFHSYVLHYV